MELQEKKVNNIQKTLDKLANIRSTANDGERLPPIPKGSVMKDSDERKKKKCGDRNLKYKPKYN